MKLFLISQSLNSDYDTYSDAVVCAKDEEEARKIHPNGIYNYKERGEFVKDKDFGSWVKKKYVKVEYIGKAKGGSKIGVVCASFHAG